MSLSVSLSTVCYICSDHGGAESTLSGEKFGDEMLWGANFDTADDADSVWDFNSKVNESYPPFQQSH